MWQREKIQEMLRTGKLGCSTASFFGVHNTEDAIGEIAKLGFSTCEVFFNTFSEYKPAFMDEIRSRIDRHHLCVSSVHALPTEFEPQLFVGSDRQKEDAFAVLESVLQGAKKLGSHLYVMHGKAIIHRGEDPLKKLDTFVAGLERALALGNQYGVTVTLENVHWAMANSPAFIRRIGELVPHLRFTLDVKQTVLAGGNPREYIEAMGERIANVHICDVDENFRTCLPGQGEIDFREVNTMLDERGYDGKVIFEIYTRDVKHQEEIEKSIRYCEEIFG